MRRREFITLICGAAAVWPVVARAQQLDRVRRIRVLIGQAESDREAQSSIAAFREELRKLGWTQHRDRHSLGDRGCRVDEAFRQRIRGAST